MFFPPETLGQKHGITLYPAKYGDESVHRVAAIFGSILSVLHTRVHTPGASPFFLRQGEWNAFHFSGWLKVFGGNTSYHSHLWEPFPRDAWFGSTLTRTCWAFWDLAFLCFRYCCCLIHLTFLPGFPGAPALSRWEPSGCLLLAGGWKDTV